MTRSFCLSLSIFFTLLGVSSWCHAEAARNPSEVPAGAASRIGAPPTLTPVVETGPALPTARHERRHYQVSADGQLTTAVCPSWATGCRFEPGSAFRLSLSSRPTPRFSWGPSVLLSEGRQTIAHAGVLQQTTNVAMALALGARVWLMEQGVVDPFLEVTSGLGSMVQSHAVTVHGIPIERASARSWVPMYSAAFGLQWHLGQHVAVGALLSWTHWLLHPAERCPAAQGVCAYPPIAAYSPDNGVIGAGMSLDISFGSLH